MMKKNLATVALLTWLLAAIQLPATLSSAQIASGCVAERSNRRPACRISMR